jgi:hypothetical protein
VPFVSTVCPVRSSCIGPGTFPYIVRDLPRAARRPFVVVDSDWAPCCGVSLPPACPDEILLADDQTPDVLARAALAKDRAFAWARRRWPDNPERAIRLMDHACGPVLARHCGTLQHYGTVCSLFLGATNWTPGDGLLHPAFPDARWAYTVEDLTPEGRALYDAIGRLSPHGVRHLLTWLDT